MLFELSKQVFKNIDGLESHMMIIHQMYDAIFISWVIHQDDSFIRLRDEATIIPKFTFKFKPTEIKCTNTYIVGQFKCYIKFGVMFLAMIIFYLNINENW